MLLPPVSGRRKAHCRWSLRGNDPTLSPQPLAQPTSVHLRSWLPQAECQHMPLPTFYPSLSAVIDGNGLRQINPFLLDLLLGCSQRNR
ncbi:hypothetical protein DPEC_G00125220 [Dallia pectoralis]|uniref:Uncharacterized protein n=1 Tax=Dallia pectoralis TaxID=75939 RepID=A0ACC2GRF6_DALPE|nr:hypothetical protein DPEC_G00125220 [Dallia pectoralis]